MSAATGNESRYQASKYLPTSIMRLLVVMIAANTLASVALAQSGFALNLDGEGSAAEVERRPAPSSAEQAAAEKEIREIFALDEKKSGDEATAQVTQLIRAGMDSAADAKAQFMLFRLAAERAAETGNLSLAFDAASRLEARYEVNAIAIRNYLFKKATHADTSPSARLLVSLAWA